MQNNSRFAKFVQISKATPSKIILSLSTLGGDLSAKISAVKTRSTAVTITEAITRISRYAIGTTHFLRDDGTRCANLPCTRNGR